MIDIRQNYDDVFLRNLIIALLYYLNDKIYIKYIEDNKERVYKVPFRIGSFKDERFLQDFFQKEIYNSLCPTSKCEGDYWAIPEGIISIQNITFDPSQFSNRFKKTQRNEINIANGDLTSVITNVNELKMSISFDVEMIANSTIETFKLWEAFLNTFYKVNQFEFNYGGIIVYANVGWQENSQLANTYEWSFGQEKEHKFTVSLEVETDYPVFDNTTREELFKEGLKYKIKIKDTSRLKEITEFWASEYGLDLDDFETIDELIDYLIENKLYNEHHTSQSLGFDIRKYFEVIEETKYKGNSIETFIIRINRDNKDFSVQRHIRDVNISVPTRNGKMRIEENNITQTEFLTTKKHFNNNPDMKINTMVNKVDGIDSDLGLVTSQNK